MERIATFDREYNVWGRQRMMFRGRLTHDSTDVRTVAQVVGQPIQAFDGQEYGPTEILMRIAVRLILTACATALVLTLASAQGGGAERQKLLDTIVARGDKAMAEGNTEQARAAWSLVLAFDPAHTSAKKKLSGLPGGGGNFVLSSEEQVVSRNVISNSWGDEWCDFPTPTPTMESVDLRMLSDTRLLPKLNSTRLGPACKVSTAPGSTAPGVYLFLAKPALSIAEVRQVYGQPQSEKKHGNGEGFESLTYGRFRISLARMGAQSQCCFRRFQNE
jgi:hypothetical protein